MCLASTTVRSLTRLEPPFDIVLPRRHWRTADSTRKPRGRRRQKPKCRIQNSESRIQKSNEKKNRRGAGRVFPSGFWLLDSGFCSSSYPNSEADTARVIRRRLAEISAERPADVRDVAV